MSSVNQQSLVSVVMIFLNMERFMEEAIESVFAQTYGNWELLLVDDGSTDRSTHIAKGYADRHPHKVRYLEHQEHQNRGMSASRNLGISHAEGAYIAFLDADDVYLPQKLERQVALLEAHSEAGMVYGPTLHWYSWTEGSLSPDRPRKLGVIPNTLIEPPSLLPIFLTEQAETPGTCGVLVRREAIERIGGFEEKFRGMFEDQAFFYKLCLTTPVFVESGSWDRYRQHADSCTQVANSKGLYYIDKPNASYHTFLKWLQNYLTQQKVNDSDVEKALGRVLWPYRHPKLYWLSQVASQSGRLATRLLKRAKRLFS